MTAEATVTKIVEKLKTIGKVDYDVDTL